MRERCAADVRDTALAILCGLCLLFAAAAIMPPQSIASEPMYWSTATGAVFVSLPPRISAIWKLFQEKIKARMAATISSPDDSDRIPPSRTRAPTSQATRKAFIAVTESCSQTTPAARRYVVGWAGEHELHVLSPRLLARTKGNQLSQEGSRDDREPLIRRQNSTIRVGPGIALSRS